MNTGIPPAPKSCSNTVLDTLNDAKINLETMNRMSGYGDYRNPLFDSALEQLSNAITAIEYGLSAHDSIECIEPDSTLEDDLEANKAKEDQILALRKEYNRVVKWRDLWVSYPNNFKGNLTESLVDRAKTKAWKADARMKALMVQYDELVSGPIPLKKLSEEQIFNCLFQNKG